jgi:hypothetical protein
MRFAGAGANGICPQALMWLAARSGSGERTSRKPKFRRAIRW